MKKYFITQIYFTENDERNNELKRVIELHKTSDFDKVYYLNEKIYGYDCDKIQESFEQKVGYISCLVFVFFKLGLECTPCLFCCFF